MNNIYSELMNLDDFEFSTRLKYFIKKSGLSRSDFYDLLEEDLKDQMISKRAFDSYFATKAGKRYPKKIVKAMATILKIDEWLLIPHTEDFQKVFDCRLKYWQRILSFSNAEEVINFNFDNIIEDFSDLESDYVEYFYKDFQKQFLENNKNISYKNKISFILILQYLLDNDKLNLDDSICDIIDCFSTLNDKGKEKLIDYGNIIINDYVYEQSSPYQYSIKALCEKYLISPDELEKDSGSFKNNIVGKIYITQLKNRLRNKISFDYKFVNFIEMLIECSNCQPYQLEIILICIFMDYKNNNFFPKDALESFLLIAQLFSLDKEFCS